MDCGDLDDFANIHLEGYGRSWRALDTGSDGYHNGSYVEADVAFGEDIEDDLDQSFVRWLHCDGYFYEEEEGDDSYSYLLPGPQHVLQWLCNMGKIPDGKYVVKMWW